MRKKFLAALVAALMLIACVPFISGCSASVNYVLSEDGSHYIASCSGYKSALKGELVIPAEYNGLPVTEIAREGFLGTGITKLVIPDSVETVGIAAFMACGSLYSVEFSGESKLERISQSMFANCSELTKIEIPQAVTSIDVFAFFQCYSLKEIVLPDNLNTIGMQAFYFTSIEQITIPASVQDKTATSEGKEYTIPAIGVGAFHSCQSLKTVVIQEGAQISTIKSGTFGYCPALEEIYLPSSLKKIEGHIMSGDKLYIGHAFHNCAALKTVHFAGTQEQWTAITKENEEYKKDGATYNNNAIINATKQYNSTYTA